MAWRACPDLPSPRLPAAAERQHLPLFAFRIVSRRRPLTGSKPWRSRTTASPRSQVILRIVAAVFGILGCKPHRRPVGWGFVRPTAQAVPRFGQADRLAAATDRSPEQGRVMSRILRALPSGSSPSARLCYAVAISRPAVCRNPGERSKPMSLWPPSASATPMPALPTRLQSVGLPSCPDSTASRTDVTHPCAAVSHAAIEERVILAYRTAREQYAQRLRRCGRLQQVQPWDQRLGLPSEYCRWRPVQFALQQFKCCWERQRRHRRRDRQRNHLGRDWAQFIRGQRSGCPRQPGKSQCWEYNCHWTVERGERQPLLCCWHCRQLRWHRFLLPLATAH